MAIDHGTSGNVNGISFNNPFQTFKFHIDCRKILKECNGIYNQHVPTCTYIKDDKRTNMCSPTHMMNNPRGSPCHCHFVDLSAGERREHFGAVRISMFHNLMGSSGARLRVAQPHDSYGKNM